MSQYKKLKVHKVKNCISGKQDHYWKINIEGTKSICKFCGEEKPEYPYHIINDNFMQRVNKNDTSYFPF